MRPHAVLALLMLVLAVPAARAATTVDEAHYVFTAPGEVKIWYNVTYTGQDAAVIREQVDFNSDGTITPQETRTAENAVLFALENPDPSIPENEFWDGAGTTHLQASSAQSKNLTGPTTATTPIALAVTGNESFNNTQRDVHTFRRTMEPDEAGTWVFDAPPGFKITRTANLTTPRLTQSDRTVSGQSGGASPIEIQFTKIAPKATQDAEANGGDGEGIPPWVWYAIGGALVLLAVVGVAFVAGRRRGAAGAAAAPLAAPPPTPASRAAPAAVRRLKCPRCSHIFTIAAGQRAWCPNCSYGR